MVDEFRETLNESQKDFYDRDGNYIMPSFEKWNRPESEYTMNFYPAFPSYLSISSFLFGTNNRVAVVLIFSIISLVNVYLITKYLSKNNKSALIVLALFVLNPVHLFFSKFPVGEIFALAFSTSGFYFLVRYFDETNESYNKSLYLLLSLTSFFVFSFTRLTFFMFLPLLVLITLLGIKKEGKKPELPLYIMGCLLILNFTYIYYKHLMYPLYDGLYIKTIVYSLNILIPLNIGITIKIIIFYLLLIMIYAGFYFEKVRNLFSKNLKALYVITGAVFFYSIFNETLKDITRLLSSKLTYLARWNMINRGIDLTKHATLFSITNYISIFGLIIFAALLIHNIIKKKSDYLTLLSFIALYFLFVYVFQTGFVRYDYYNSRYFLTEVTPSLLIAIGAFLGHLMHNKSTKFISKLFLYLIIVYFSIFSFIQIGRTEGADNKFFYYIDEKTNGDSIILFINKRIYDNKYPKNFNDYVAGPLKYYFAKKVVMLRSEDEINSNIVKQITDGRENVYILSNVPLNTSEFSIEQEKITLNYNHFNNSPGCGYHNYEFLQIDDVNEIPLPYPLKCMLLPNAYYSRSRDYYFGRLK